jgi:hypothetical protein
MCWGSWTPPKVKLAVSGYPHNADDDVLPGFDAHHADVLDGVEVRVTDHLSYAAPPRTALALLNEKLNLPSPGTLARHEEDDTYLAVVAIVGSLAELASLVGEKDLGAGRRGRPGMEECHSKHASALSGTGDIPPVTDFATARKTGAYLRLAARGLS